VPARGGRAKRLGQNECCPVWSPNGRQVVFGFAQNQDLITLATGRVKILHIPGGPLAWQALPK
jgi:hypothetical protein